MKALKLALIYFIILLNCTLAKGIKLQEPYNSIIILPPDMQGWFNPENKKNLEYLITTYKPQCIVELGTWLGLSAIHMASILPDDGILYAIDDWTADSDIYIKNTPGLELKIPLLYQQFLSNVKHANLCHKIVPMRMKTLEAAKSLNLKPELIYIDASHDEVSVFSDIINWYPKLNNGGIMCGDDWYFESVRKAVRKAAEKLGLSIKTEGNFWYFYPLK